MKIPKLTAIYNTAKKDLKNLLKDVPIRSFIGSISTDNVINTQLDQMVSAFIMFGNVCSQVLACRISLPDQFTQPQMHRTYYLYANSTGCSCYDYYGAYCVASCVSNVSNHEVRSVDGTGMVTAVCSSDNDLLGCGFKPFPKSDAEFYLYNCVTAKTNNSCTCYHSYGVTCYAIMWTVYHLLAYSC
jgi:hypothetical protein